MDWNGEPEPETGDPSHILILEDDRTHQELISRSFRNLPDEFRVSIAGTLREAREIIGRDLPVLIIADWILPDGKGLEILPRTDGRVTIPLVIMTSYGDEHLAVEIMKSGAIDYIVKSATMFRDLPHISRRALRDWENINERVRAEENVKESQKRLVDILGILPDAVFAIDNDRRVIAWNKAMELMTGIAAASMLGKKDHEYSLPLYGERRPLLVDLVLEEDPETEKRYDYIRRDGERITSETFIPGIFGGRGAYLWGTASPLYDPAGNRVGAIEVIRDITGRKQAEIALKKREGILKTLLNAPTDTIALLDRQGTIMDINNEGARRLGSTPEDLIGRCVYDLLSADLAVSRKVHIDRVFENGEPARFDDLRSDHYFHNEIFPIFNPERTTIESIAIFANEITEKKKADLALQESEEKYRNLAENVHDGIYIYDGSAHFRFVNHRAADISGYSEEELLSMNILDLVHPDDNNLIRDIIAKRFSGAPAPETYELRIIKKDGAERVLEISVSQITFKGQFATLGAARDITERKEAEEALRESEEKFRALVDGAAIGVGYWTPEGVLLYLNEISLKRLKGKEEDFIGKNMRGLFGESGAAMYIDRLSKAAVSTSPIEYEDYVTLPSGKGWYLSVFTRITNPDGTVRGIQVLSMDITDRKLGEVKLRESEERYRSVIENAAEGIAIAQDGILQYANARLLEMAQFSPDEIIGRPFTVFVHPDDRAIVLERYQDRIAGGNPVQNYDFRILGKTGKIVWVQLSAVRIEWNGRPATLNFLMNITDRRQAEERLRESRQILEGILNTIPVRVFWKDKELTYLGCNVAFAQDAGFEKAEDIVGKNDYSMGWREQAELYQADDLAVIRSGKPKLMIEEPQTTPAGDTIYLLTSKMPLRDARGDVIGVLGSYLDITDRKKAEEMLRESEIRFRDLFNNMHAGVAVYDPTSDGQDFIIRDVNRAVETIEQVKKEEIVGKSVRDVFPGVVEFGLFDVFRRVAATGIAESHPVSVYHDNRISGWRENYVYKLPSGEIVAIYEDVTEKKQAEEKLRDSEKKYHGLYDGMRDAFASVDMGGRITLFNEPFQKMLGYDKEDLYTLNYNDLSPEKWHAIEADIIKNEVLTRGYSDIYEKEYRRKDGTVFPVELRTFLVRDNAGNPQSMSAVIRDITERKLAEEKLLESEEKFRDIFNNVNDAIQINEPDEGGFPGRLIEVNDVACRMLQYSREELLGRSPLEFATDYHSRPLGQIIGELQTVGHATFETGHVRKDGTVVAVEINSHVATLLGKEVIVSVVRDITERKHAEQVMSMTNRIYQIANRAGSLQEMLRSYVEEFQSFSGCEAVGIRLLDSEGNIPYQAYVGFPEAFYEKETPLSVKSDECMCIYVINGTISTDLPVATPRGSFYCNATSKFLATVSEAEKGHTRNVCNQMGYESVALIPIRTPKGIMGLVQFNDHRENMVPLEMVRIMEDVALSLWETIRRMQAEDRVQKSETRFRALIQNSSDIIRILDRDGLIVYESPSSERILGYPAGSLTGRDPLAFIHPEDLAHVKQDFSEVLEGTNHGVPTEFRIRKADGEYIWVDSIGTNLLDVQGVNGIVITTRPIQQRKQVEDALRASEQMNRMLLENTKSGIVIIDREGIYQYANKLAAENMGVPPEEIIGKSMKDFLPEETARYYLEQNRDLIDSCTGKEYEATLPLKTGTRSFLIVDQCIRNAEGKGVALQSSSIEITDRKLMESEIRSLNTSLEQRVLDRTEALTRANEALEVEITQRLEAEKKLQASYDEKVMLLKEIHHRVKNNLQIVASLLNLQSRYITDAQTLAAIRESQNRVKAMALVHERLYRTEDISHISLHDYIKFLGTGLFQFYDAKRRGIRFTLEMGDISVDTDTAIPLGLILNELISNSLKYAFPDERSGEISVHVNREDHTLTVLYRDTGIGIPADLDWRNTQSLGLRLVITLVEQLDGTVDLDRQDGTRFTMILHEKEQRGPV